jgi:uncharacterized damage-inducible protein DinB
MVSTFGAELAGLYGRELDRLAESIADYPSDIELWSTSGAQKNSAGTLALHLVGGLLAMIGATFGATGYVRDRDREFSERDVAREEVARRVRACRDVVVPIVRRLDDATLAQTYPGPIPPAYEGMTSRAFLVHLLWHLGWHLGQIHYHRLGRTESVGEGA